MDEPTIDQSPQTTPQDSGGQVNGLVEGVQKKYYPHKTVQEVSAAIYANKDTYQRTLEKIYADNFEAKGISRDQFNQQVVTKYGNPFPDPEVKKKAPTAADNGSPKSSDGLPSEADKPVSANDPGYQNFLKTIKQAPSNLGEDGNGLDYDLKAYYNKYGKANLASNGHLSDEFKKPNHMTFSDESVYSNANQQGGKWVKIGDKWEFHASEFNLKQHSPEELKQYFNKYEPDSKLVLPQIPTAVQNQPTPAQDIGNFYDTARNSLLAFKNKRQVMSQDNTAVVPVQQTSAKAAAVSDAKEAAADKAIEDKYTKKHGEFWGGVHLGVDYAATKLAHGGTEALRGLATATRMMNGQSLTAPLDEYVANTNLNKLEDASTLVDPNYDHKGVVGAIGGVLQTVPALLASESTGGASFFFQGMGSAEKQVNELKKQGVKFDNHTDDLFKIGSGIINYGLTKIDAGPLLSGSSSQIKNNVVGQLVADGVKSLGKNLDNVTTEDVVSSFMKPVMTFSQRLNQYGQDYLNSYVHNTAVMGALNVADYGLKSTVNALNKKDVFNQNPQDLVDNLKRVLTVDAPLFSSIGAVTSMGKLFKNSPYENTVVSDLQKDSSPENVQRIKTVLTNIGLEKGWTEKDLADTNQAIDLMADVASKLPKGISPQNFHAGVNLVMNRRQLENILDYTQSNKEGLDPAIAGKATAYESLLKAKIEQANDKLSEVVTGKNFEYFFKDGKYYKQVPGETLEEISKDRFDVENADNKTSDIGTENVVPKGPEVTVKSAAGNRDLTADDIDYLAKNGSKAVQDELAKREENITHTIEHNDVADQIISSLDNRDEAIKEAAKPKPAEPAKPATEPVVSKKETPTEPVKTVDDAFESLKKPVTNQDDKKITIVGDEKGNSVKAIGADGKEYGSIELKKRNNVSHFINGEWKSNAWLNDHYDEYLKGNYGNPKDIKTKNEPDWMYVSNVNVAPEIRGNRLQDVLYQKAIDQAKKLGYKGIVSGDALMQSDITTKLHQRFNHEMIRKSNDLKSNDIVGLTGHKNENFVNEWLNNYNNEGATKSSDTTPTKVESEPKEKAVKAVDESAQATEITPARKKAIDAVVHGVVVPEKMIQGDDSARFDFGMTTAEKQKAVKDIHQGKYNTAPAKKLLDKLEQFDNTNEYPIVEGLGGNSIRRRAATSAEIQQQIDEAKQFKLNQKLTTKDIEANDTTLADLGFTHQDAEDYENYIRSTEGTGSNGQSPESTTVDVRQGDDQGTSAAQGSGDKGLQGKQEPVGEKFTHTPDTWTHLTNSKELVDLLSTGSDFIGRGENLEHFTKEVSNKRFNITHENGLAPYFQQGKFYGEPKQKYLITTSGDHKFTPNINHGNAQNFEMSAGVGVLNPEFRKAGNFNIYEKGSDGEYYKIKSADDPYYVSLPSGVKEVPGEPVANNHGLDLFSHEFDNGKGFGVSEGSTGLQIGKGLTRQDAIDNALGKLESRSSTDVQQSIEAKFSGGMTTPRGQRSMSVVSNIDTLPDNEIQAANTELEKDGLTLQDIKDYEQSTGSAENNAEDLRQQPNDQQSDEVKTRPDQEVETQTDRSEAERPVDKALEQAKVYTPEVGFIDRVGDSITSGEKMNIVSMRKLAEELGVVGDDVKLQDLAETAVVNVGRKVALNPELTDDQKLQEMIKIYNSQPSFLQRSSDRVELMQYSTPLPTAFIGGLYGKAIAPARIFEPSAGNGLLTIAFDPRKVSVNEIDKNRLANLGRQPFYDIGKQDASLPFPQNGTKDFVFTNPPFGKSGERVYDGYRISGLDEQMIINALDQMKDTGRAVFIMGGHNKYDKTGRLSSDRTFFNFLYSHYNVSDVINLDGSLYQKQGTTFPIRMVLINGRKSVRSGVAPLFDKTANKPIASFQDLYDRVQTKILNDENRNLLQSGVDAERNIKPAVYGSDTFIGDTPAATEPIAVPENKVSRPDTGSDISRGERAEPVGGPAGVDDNQPRADENSGRYATIGQLSALSGDDEPVTARNVEAPARDRQAAGNEPVQRDRPQQDSRELADQLVTHDKIPYAPASNARPVGSVIPSNMATEAARVLKNIEDEHGNIDVFVSSRLGYPSLNDMYDAFSAEQVDALAMGIAQMEAGKGMIVGDMTGVGKGRIAAGMVRYGIKQGKVPIFLTEKATLFSDLYRDLVDIGSAQYVPFIVNDKSSDNDPTITDAGGQVVHKVPNPQVKAAAFKDGSLPNGYDFIMSTYSQFTSSKPSDKKNFIKAVSDGQPMIMDESHNVSGLSNSGQFFQDILQSVQGVMYLSATFAKRPDNMPVYAMKTSMSEANMSHDALVEAIRKGGVALQEIVSAQLVESGQMLRRERDFTGVKNNFHELNDLSTEHRRTADQITDIVRDIISFQRDFVNDIIANMDEEMASEGGLVSKTKGTNNAGVDNTPFSSKVFNVIDQMLFAIKAESVADRAIMRLKENKKPVIAFKSTMESFLKNSGLEVGDNIQNPNFALSLKRGLDSAMSYTVTNAQGDKEKRQLDVADLDPQGVKAYNAIVDKVKSSTANISISPIDIIVKKLKDAGYNVGEITGRKMQLEFNPDGSATVKAREDRDIKSIVRKFNNGEGVDVILLNASGATGLSMHASSKFKDQRQRNMITHQIELDINKEVQKRGRIDRSGQVVRGEYDTVFSSIPAEKRLAMMFKSKLKSLDANTTSSQKSQSSEEINDFINKYGDKIVIGYLKENPELNADLLDPFGISQMDQGSLDKLDTEEGAALKVTGRVAILPSEKQEQFYSDIMNRYADLIQYLEDTNQNDLEVKSLPLNAETVSRRPFVVGTGGNSPFGRDSVLEKVNSDVLRKPLTKDELEEEITNNLNGVTPAQSQKVLMGTLNRFYEARIKMVEEALRGKYANKRNTALDTYGDNADELANQLQVVKNLEKYDIDSKVGQLEKDEQNIGRVIDSFRVGEDYDVPATISSEKTTYSRGVFLGFELGKNDKNPFAPSNVKMKFAVLDGRRVVAVPLSQGDFVNAALAGKLQRKMYPGKPMREEWGTMKEPAAREQRYIITGNILQAYNRVGQLIAFTTNQGQLRKGILMPKGFEPSKEVIVPATRALESLINMGTWDTDSTTDKTITIQKLRGSRYAIQVPAAKSTGGIYFLDADLRAIVDGNNFNTQGAKMVGEFDESSLPKLLSVLQNKFGKSFNIEGGEEQATEEPGPEPKQSARDYIFDQGNVQSVLDYLEKLKAKGKQALGLLVPIPPAVFNKAIDMIKSIVKVTNSAQKAVRVAVRYLRDNGANNDQVSAFVQEMQDFFENTPAVKLLLEKQQQNEDRRTALDNLLHNTISEATQSSETGLSSMDVREYKTKLTDILSRARQLNIIKHGEADAIKANEAISAVNNIHITDPKSVQDAVLAVKRFFDNEGDKGDLKQAQASRAQLRPFLNKKDSALPGSMLKDLVGIDPKTLSGDDLAEYKEIAGTLGEQLNGNLPGLIANERIVAFTDKIKEQQELALRAKLAKQFASFGADSGMTLDELLAIKNEAKALNEDDGAEPVDRVNKKRALLDMFIESAREDVRKATIEPQYQQMVDNALKVDTSKLSTGEMKLYNQVLNNIAINNDYRGVGLFNTYHEADNAIGEFKSFAAPYMAQFRQISFGAPVKDFVKGSTASKLSLTDKFFHLNSDREVGTKLDSLMAFPINQGYQKQQNQKAQLTERFRKVRAENKLNRDNMFRIGVYSDLNEHDLNMGSTPEEQFQDGVERLRQAVEKLRPFKTKYERTMFSALAEIYDQVKDAKSIQDMGQFLTPQEQKLYDYTQSSWKQTYPALKENNDLYSFDRLGEIENYAHRKYYNVGGKIDVNLIDNDNIDVRTSNPTGEAGTKISRVVRRTLPTNKIIDYNIFNSFNKGMNETLNDIHTLPARLKANRMLKSSELPAVIDMADRYKKTNTQILTDGIKLMVNVQRGLAKSDSDLYGAGQKITSMVRQAFYAHTTGAALSAIPQYASSVAFILPQLENPSAFWKSFNIFVGGGLSKDGSGNSEFRDMAKELMQRIGGGIVNRDVQGDHDLSAQLNSAAESMLGQFTDENLAQAIQKVQDIYFASLKFGDRSIALHGWLAGYINSLIKQKVIKSASDFNIDFLRDHLNSPNQVAAAEAENLVTLSNNESDSSRRPESFVNKTHRQELLNDILYPLKKFAVSMYNKMMLGVRNLSEMNGGEVDGAKLIIGALASSVIFNAIGQTIGAGYDKVADEAMKLLGDYDNEENMLEKHGSSHEDQAEKKFEQQKKNLVTATVGDLFLNGQNAIVEQGAKRAANLVYEQIMQKSLKPSGELDPWGNPVKAKSPFVQLPFYMDNNPSSFLGIYSDTPLGVVLDASTDKHGPYQVLAEQFKYKGFDGILSKRVLFSLGVPTLTASGLLPADVNLVNQRVKKRIEKLYEIEREYKKKYPNKDNPDYEAPEQ